jgi:c-di-GMP-binding flagellar brake protein YcgR
LGVDVLSTYMQARADLGAMLVLAQRLEIRADVGARQAVRVARAVPVEFDLRNGKVSSLTQDISVSGLSALVGEALTLGTLAPFRLKLGRDTQLIAGRCRVVANIPSQGSVRMAATFEEIAKEGRSRIETLVFDAICSEIRVMLRSGQPQDLPAGPPLPRP